MQSCSVLRYAWSGRATSMPSRNTRNLQQQKHAELDVTLQPSIYFRLIENFRSKQTDKWGTEIRRSERGKSVCGRIGKSYREKRVNRSGNQLSPARSEDTEKEKKQDVLTSDTVHIGRHLGLRATATYSNITTLLRNRHRTDQRP